MLLKSNYIRELITNKLTDLKYLEFKQITP